MMKKYGIVEACLKFFFPMREEVQLVCTFPSRAFPFDCLSSVYVYAYRYLDEKNPQYVLFFSARPLSESILCRKESRDRFKEMGREFQKIEMVEAGKKNLSIPPAPYLQEKWIFQFEGEKENLYLLLPDSFLRECLGHLGFGWMKEFTIDSKDASIENLESFERSVLYGRCQFFENPISYLKSLDKKFIPNLFMELMSRKLLSYNHIASFQLFYSEEFNIIDFLPKEIQKVVLRLSESIRPFLISSKTGMDRWKRKLDYYFQNVLSVLLFEQGTKNFYYDFQKLELFYYHINKSRLNMLNSITSLSRLLGMILERGKHNELIRTDTTSLLIKNVAFGEDLSLKELFSKFRPDFQKEFEFKLKEYKQKITKLPIGKKIQEEAAVKLKLLQALEDILLKKYENSIVPTVSTEFVYRTIKSADSDRMTFIYNTLGFEILASLFRGLKYKEDSPLFEGDADLFFMEKISLLPGIEGEIVEDLYFEKLNSDRIINEEVMEREFQEAARRIAVVYEISGVYVNG